MALELGGEPREGRPDYGAPPPDRFARGGRAVFFSDFLGDPDGLMPALAQAADQGVRGCFVQVLDESEEVFPFDGRVIFESMGGGTEFETQRARALREAYGERLAERRARLQRARPQPRLARALPPHQPEPARGAALALHGGGRTAGEMIGSARLHRALAAARARHAADPLVAAARDPAGAGAPGVPRGAAAARPHRPREDARAHAVVAACCCAWSRWRRRSSPSPGRC